MNNDIDIFTDFASFDIKYINNDTILFSEWWIYFITVGRVEIPLMTGTQDGCFMRE